jgi:hypothetical protein
MSGHFVCSLLTVLRIVYGVGVIWQQSYRMCDVMWCYVMLYGRHVKPRVPEGHMGHICVVMRATHDIWPAGRMFDMPDRVCFLYSKCFFTLGNSLSYFQV